MMRVAVVTLLVVLLSACSGAGGGDEAGRAGYQVAVCGAIRGLAGNRDDFTAFKTASSAAEASAALSRVQQRTRDAIAGIQVAASWSPGKSVSDELVGNQQELLSILADFQTVTQTGDNAAFQAATAHYDAWYGSTIALLPGVLSSMQALGVACVLQPLPS